LLIGAFFFGGICPHVGTIFEIILWLEFYWFC